MNISVGQPFPQFSSRTHDGQYFDLASLAGKNIVLYFYPKDDTPGCTCEAKEFSHLLHQFEELHTQVIGVSTDPLDSHKRFAGKYNLKVPLISDSEKTLTQALGITRSSGSAARTTFLIDGEGIVRKIWETVNPNGHAQAILNYIKEMMQQGRKAEKISGRERIKKTRAYHKA